MTTKRFTITALDMSTWHAFADIAAGLLDDIEASEKPDLGQTAIDELDRRILDAMTTLGVSDTRIGGVPG